MEQLIKRINELAKKKREEGLTVAEQKEQQELYKKYLSAIRGNFKAQLNNTDVEYPDGKTVPLTQFKKNS